MLHSTVLGSQHQPLMPERDIHRYNERLHEGHATLSETVLACGRAWRAVAMEQTIFATNDPPLKVAEGLSIKASHAYTREDV